MVRFTCNSSLTFFRIEDQVVRVLSVSKICDCETLANAASRMAGEGIAWYSYCRGYNGAAPRLPTATMSSRTTTTALIPYCDEAFA